MSSIWKSFFAATLLVFATLLTSCGQDDCFAVGPIGSCTTKQPAGEIDKDGRRVSGASGGEFRVNTFNNRSVVKSTDSLDILASGGVPPYHYQVVSGPGDFESETSRTFHIKDGRRNDKIEIRVWDSASPPAELPVFLKVQVP